MNEKQEKTRANLRYVFGNMSRVAEICRISRVAVSYWQSVPDKHHQILITHAKKLGYKLTIKQLRGQE